MESRTKYNLQDEGNAHKLSAKRILRFCKVIMVISSVLMSKVRGLFVEVK